jgi:very-short-patch-repair endonuclease
MPTRQLQFRGSDGRLRFLDAVFDPWRLAVEVDGAHHASVRQMWDDIDRQNEIALAGYRVLRFPAHVVRTRPHLVAAQLRAALELAGWRPSRSKAV